MTCHRRALAIRPDYAEAHNFLGAALYNRNWYDEAMTCHARALALRPDYIDAQYNMSLCLAKLG